MIAHQYINGFEEDIYIYILYVYILYIYIYAYIYIYQQIPIITSKSIFDTLLW